MKVLVDCEESQTVCKAFRKRGHEAYSCDIIECSGGRSEWHIMQDVLPLLNGNCEVETVDGTRHKIEGKWDMIIAHPPCTYLTVTGNRWFDVVRYGRTAQERWRLRCEAVVFFLTLYFADCEKVVVENPIGIINSIFKKPDQIVQPWMFGHATTKSTCLWLRGVPRLVPTDIVEVDANDVYEYVAKNGRIKHDSRSRSKCSKEERSRHRSKTPIGLAKAMAEQWG